MRTIVVGASGQIGGWLSHYLQTEGHEVVGTYATVAYPQLIRMDASDLAAARSWVKEQRADVVFYPAGFTWVDGCERDPGRAFSANLDQPLNLARAVAEGGGRFVYFSTDYVFDGESGPYGEEAATRPLSVYGRSKRDAELAIEAELGPLQLTVRTSWVFGPERQGKNFAYQLVKSLKAGKALECPSDQISSPSYGPDVAKVVTELVSRGVSGLVHVVGPEVMGRVEFARALAQAFQLDASLIIGRATSELAQGAPRPLNGGLLNDRLQSLGIAPPRDLQSASSDFLAKLDLTDDWADPR